MPQAGLSIHLDCGVLVTQEGRVSCVSNLLANTYYLLLRTLSQNQLCAGLSGRMIQVWNLSVTNSDLLIQLRFISERLKALLESWYQHESCLPKCPSLTLPTVASNSAQLYIEKINGTSYAYGLPMPPALCAHTTHILSHLHP